MVLTVTLIALLAAEAPTCPATGLAVVVDTAQHRLALCEGGAATRVYEVAIGSNGPAPKRVGWAQTPLGTFRLTAPRPSKQFHVFIPLANPDPKRFSAWAIGVHGPQRGWERAGHVNVESDWTLGCIAVSSDEEIDAIAAGGRSARGAHRRALATVLQPGVQARVTPPARSRGEEGAADWPERRAMARSG